MDKTFTTEQLNNRDAAIAELVRISRVRNQAGSELRTLKPEGRDSLDYALVSKAKLRKLLNDAYRAGFEKGESHATNR